MLLRASVIGVPLFFSASRIVAADAVGAAWLRRATIPAANGAEAEVPQKRLLSYPPPMSGALVHVGAHTSSFAPESLKHATCPTPVTESLHPFFPLHCWASVYWIPPVTEVS